MKTFLRNTAAAALLLGATACGPAEAEIDAAAHMAEIMEWREGRLSRLLAPNGFLTQVGLYWIDDGSYIMGSAADSDIVLPATAAPVVGEIRVADGAIEMSVAEGVEVRSADGFVTEISLPADTSGENVMLLHGSIAWSVIERGGKYAIRVRDYEHPWVETFGPLPYYDIDPAWRIEATLHPYAEPREVAVNTVIEGFQQFPVAPGTVTFEIAGEEFELEPTLTGDQLFFVFGDKTNRDATYGAGRYLYTDIPGEDGKFIIDFNKAYSPPCAFNAFSTCPVASPRNRLPLRVEVGEKYDPALFYSPDGAH
jgi:uncharacterized protein (DUF1684 family)